VLVESAAANRPAIPIELETFRVNTRTGELHMSAKITFAALATLLTAVSVQTAAARGVSPTASDLRSDPAFHRLQGSRAFGSINVAPGAGRSSDNVFFGNKAVGRDPDSNVRLELLRDKDIGKY
jgi:hypothetical protein